MTIGSVTEVATSGIYVSFIFGSVGGGGCVQNLCIGDPLM
jgi:hypothetical protein